MVITCKAKDPITKEDILAKVDEWQIMRYYSGGEVKLGMAVKSPFRKDSRPSMSYYIGQEGNLRYHDHGDDKFTGDCITMVMQLHNINYRQALEKIASDMGISNGSNEYRRIVQDYEKPNIDRRRNSFIQILFKQYTARDIQWWAQYGISQQMLEQEHVYSLREVYIDRQKYPVNPQELIYGYWYPEGVKIYMPEREKERKWLSSITTATIEGMDKLNGQDKVIITKSKKDRMLLQTLFPELLILNTQNESLSCYNDKLIEKIQGKKVYINYDSDEAGIKASWRVNQKYPWMLHVNVPYEYLPLKDWSDVYKKLGPVPIIEHMKRKGIIE